MALAAAGMRPVDLFFAGMIAAARTMLPIVEADPEAPREAVTALRAFLAEIDRLKAEA